MPPVKLPADVWIEIIKACVSLQIELSSFVLTSKNICELVRPILFRRLEFHNDETTYPLSLYQTIARVESLRNSPHLIQHVRTVMLDFFEHPRDEVHRPLWNSSYKAVTNLLSKLPYIRRLELRRCTISPQLHLFVYHNPPLTSLDALCCSWSRLHDALFEEQADIHLETLKYYPDLGPWRVGILRNCLVSLVSLSIRVDEVLHVLSSTQGRQLSLRQLEIARGLHNEQDPARIYELLVLCPGLRKFHPGNGIQVNIRNITMLDLPHLEGVWGSPSIIRALVPGRPVHSVKIIEDMADTFTDNDVNMFGGSSSVKNLQYHLEPSSYDQIMRLPYIFPNASRAFFYVMTMEQKQVNVFTHVLLLWSGLKVFHLDGCVPMKVARETFRSFIGPLGVPTTRVHPELEEVGLRDSFVWRRCPAEGWTFYDRSLD